MNGDALRKYEDLFLDNIPKWNFLAIVGRSHIFKLTPLVPIFGYMIIFNDKMKDAMALWVDGINVSEVSASIEIRLYYLYFGFILLSISSIIFAWRCPQAIKRNIHKEEYISSDLGSISVNEKRNIVGEVNGYLDAKLRAGRFKDQVDYSQYRTVMTFCHQLYKFGYLNKGEGNYMIDALTVYYEIMNKSYAVARFFCFAMMVSGGVLVSIPSMKVFVQVLSKALVIVFK